MIISLIAAIGKNNELGKGNDLIWKLPADQKFFRETTTGHPMVMGRKTFESLPGILPDRKHIVITRDKSYLRPTDAKALAGKHDVDVVGSLEEALAPFKNTETEVMVIGGAEIFRQSMDIANRLYITEVDAEDKAAEVFFPPIDKTKWREVSRLPHSPDDKNPLPYTFIIYERA